MLSASHTARAQKTPFGVGFQEWHASIRLSTDHLEDISLGDPTVVITLAGLGTNLVTSQAYVLLGDFCHLPLPC